MLVIGVCLGLLYARLSLPSEKEPTWRGMGYSALHSSFGTSSSSRQAIILPSLKQRKRVLELLSTLTPRYTERANYAAVSGEGRAERGGLVVVNGGGA